MSIKKTISAASRIDCKPEILIGISLALICSLFQEFIPTTADDYSNIINGSGQGWIAANRLHWLVTAPINDANLMKLFSERYVYGLHVLTMVVPSACYYIILRKEGLLKEARLSLIATLSIQIIGYEHTTPLAYPILYTLANSISILSGYILARRLARVQKNKTHKSRMRLAVAIILPIIILSWVWYETNPLLAATSGTWAIAITAMVRDREELTTKDSEKARKENKQIWRLAKIIFCILVPIILVASLKLAGSLLYGVSISGQSTNTQIPIGKIQDFNYLAKSVEIALNTLKNATITGYITEATKISATDINMSAKTILFCICMTSSTIITLGNSEKKANKSQRRKRLVCIFFLSMQVILQLIIHSMTVRHHVWYLSGMGTYLNASLAVPATSSLAAIILVGMQKEFQHIGKITITALVVTTSFLSFKKNSELSKIYNNNINTYETLIGICLDPKHQKTRYNNIFNQDPINKPIPLHPDAAFEGSESPFLDVYCRDARKKPSLFRNWIRNDISEQEKNNFKTYGTTTPEDKTLLAASVGYTSDSLEANDNEDILWIWHTKNKPGKLKLRIEEISRTVKNTYSVRIFPSSAYRKVFAIDESGNKNRRIVIDEKGLAISKSKEGLNDISLNDIRFIQVQMKDSDKIYDVSEDDLPRKIGPNDPRRAYIQIRFETNNKSGEDVDSI